uniref:Uncharacterized protein n=1 Tax=Ditylenchus dipsaci TaxID=166011 RepID=A0A915CZT7_9BILA
MFPLPKFSVKIGAKLSEVVPLVSNTTSKDDNQQTEQKYQQSTLIKHFFRLSQHIRSFQRMSTDLGQELQEAVVPCPLPQLSQAWKWMRQRLCAPNQQV